MYQMEVVVGKEGIAKRSFTKFFLALRFTKQKKCMAWLPIRIYFAKMGTTVFLLLAITGTSVQKFYGYKKGKRQYSDVASTFGKSLLVHFFLRRRNQGNTFKVRRFLSSQNRFFLSETDCDAFHLLRQHLLRVMPKRNKNIIGRKRSA